MHFETDEELDRLVRAATLERLNIVAEKAAGSRETAAIVERDHREVSRNRNDLESLGVGEFETDGQRKRPLPRARAETIDRSSPGVSGS